MVLDAREVVVFQRADEFPDSGTGLPTGVAEIGGVRAATKSCHQRSGEILLDGATSCLIPNADGLVNGPHMQARRFRLGGLSNRPVPVCDNWITVESQ